MGQVHHGNATTTAAVRRAIRHSQASLRALAAHYGINSKIVAKWKMRPSIIDHKTGPSQPKSTVFRSRRRPSSSPSAGTLCWRLTTASTPSSQRYRTSHVQRCTAASNAMASRGCPRSMATGPCGRSSIDIDRLLPHRHRRGAHRRGQALPTGGIDRTSKFAFVELEQFPNGLTRAGLSAEARV